MLPRGLAPAPSAPIFVTVGSPQEDSFIPSKHSVGLQAVRTLEPRPLTCVPAMSPAEWTLSTLGNRICVLNRQDCGSASSWSEILAGWDQGPEQGLAALVWRGRVATARRIRQGATEP